MAISVIELASALRLSDGLTAPPEPYASMLVRYISVAEEFIDLESPTAPDAVRNEATVRLAGWLYDAPSAGRGLQFANAWRSSGAASLIERWKSIRVVIK